MLDSARRILRCVVPMLAMLLAIARVGRGVKKLKRGFESTISAFAMLEGLEFSVEFETDHRNRN